MLQYWTFGSKLLQDQDLHNMWPGPPLGAKARARTLGPHPFLAWSGNQPPSSSKMWSAGQMKGFLNELPGMLPGHAAGPCELSARWQAGGRQAGARCLVGCGEQSFRVLAFQGFLWGFRVLFFYGYK